MLTLQFSENQVIFAYNGFLILATLFALFWYFREGKRLEFPMSTWLLVVAVTQVLLVIGSRLGAFSITDWMGLWAGQSPAHAQKTILGGLLLALLGYQLLRRHFHLPASVADSLFLGLPLAAMVGRMGCVVAGCCFGTPTQMPWAVQYGEHSSVFRWQWAEGLVAENAVHSLPVHPVQLYLIAGNILIFIILLKIRPRLKKAGSLAILSIALLMTNRFFLEFFRDISTNRGLTGQLYLGLKGAQWVALVLMALSFITFVYREKKGLVFKGHFQPGTFKKELIGLLGLTLFAFIGRSWLSFVEIWIVVISIAPLHLYFWYQLWRRQQSAQTVLAPAGVLSVAAIVLMAIPRDSMQPIPLFKPAPAPRENQNWFEIGSGGTFGYFKDIERNCDGDITNIRKVRNISAALDLSFHHEFQEYTEIALGYKSSIGGAKLISGNPVDGSSQQYIVGGPYMDFQSKPIGLSFGLLYGPDLSKSNFYPTVPKERPYFAGGARLGMRHRYYFDVQFYNQHSFTYFPYPSLSIGVINWGFNDLSGRSLLRGGLGVMGNSVSLMAAGRFPIRDSNFTGDVSLFVGNENMISLGLRYGIPLRRR
jgi:prolipoprotein diacylglyceryltransferase